MIIIKLDKERKAEMRIVARNDFQQFYDMSIVDYGKFIKSIGYGNVSEEKLLRYIWFAVNALDNSFEWGKYLEIIDDKEKCKHLYNFEKTFDFDNNEIEIGNFNYQELLKMAMNIFIDASIKPQKKVKKKSQTRKKKLRI